MPDTTPFKRFSPAILNIYRRDKEAFWEAVMAPFLASGVSLMDWMHNLRVDASLLRAFNGLDQEARIDLKSFSEPLGLDVNQWTSNRVLLDSLGDRFLTRLVDSTELRLISYYRKELKLAV
jgi:hypothetical protein